MPVDAEQTPSRFERWRRATLAPFEHRAFALFWWASLASSFGSMIQTVGASWLMATIAPSPNQVALVQTANALPYFFLSLLAGALADTRDRRSIMLVSQVLALLASVALAVVALAGGITPSLLLGLTFLIGCGAAMFAPAWQASIGDQVPRALIAPAVMANSCWYVCPSLAKSVRESNAFSPIPCAPCVRFALSEPAVGTKSSVVGPAATDVEPYCPSKWAVPKAADSVPALEVGSRAE